LRRKWLPGFFFLRRTRAQGGVPVGPDGDFASPPRLLRPLSGRGPLGAVPGGDLPASANAGRVDPVPSDLLPIAGTDHQQTRAQPPLAKRGEGDAAVRPGCDRRDSSDFVACHPSTPARGTLVSSSPFCVRRAASRWSRSPAPAAGVENVLEVRRCGQKRRRSQVRVTIRVPSGTDSRGAVTPCYRPVPEPVSQNRTNCLHAADAEDRGQPAALPKVASTRTAWRPPA